MQRPRYPTCAKWANTLWLTLRWGCEKVEKPGSEGESPIMLIFTDFNDCIRLCVWQIPFHLYIEPITLRVLLVSFVKLTSCPFRARTVSLLNSASQQRFCVRVRVCARRQSCGQAQCVGSSQEVGRLACGPLPLGPQGSYHRWPTDISPGLGSAKTSHREQEWDSWHSRAKGWKDNSEMLLNESSTEARWPAFRWDGLQGWQIQARFCETGIKGAIERVGGTSCGGDRDAWEQPGK